MNAQTFQLLFYYYRALHPAVSVTARLPLAQAVHESTNFTSHIYETYNNMFGMTVPQARETLALNKGTKDAFARFSSPMDSIGDYFYWLEAFGITNDAQLDTFIKTRYAADKAYYAKVSRRVAELAAAGAYISPTAIYAGTAAAAVAVALGAGAIIHEVTK